MAYQPGDWESFALAHVGASAALLGLVFVGISINLRDIIGSGVLVHRALEAVVLLGSVLVAATLVLIPGQARGAVSAELVVSALALAAVVLFIQRDATNQQVDPGRPVAPRGSVAIRRALGLGTAVVIAVAGLSLAAQVGGGLYWWPLAVITAYFGALGNAWILLIEILR
jgi:modulator of FtsH protease